MNNREEIEVKLIWALCELQLPLPSICRIAITYALYGNIQSLCCKTASITIVIGIIYNII